MSDVDELIKLMKRQHDETKKQNDLIFNLIQMTLSANSGSAPTGNTADPSCIVTALSARIPMFEFDPENGKTFPKWLKRYGEVITEEGKTLDETTKVRLLLNKLPDDIYEQYASKICPKVPSAESYDDVVATLSDYFDVKRSLWSWRFSCTQISRMDENPVAYTARINEVCEKAMLKDVTPEEWKTFFWLKGLDAPGDTQVRAHFINFMERRAEIKQATTIMDLCEEWLRIQRQKTEVQEFGQKKVSELKVKKPIDAESGSLKKITCWNCGKDGHASTVCHKSKASCAKCHRKGHLERFCKLNRENANKRSQNGKTNTWNRCKAITVAKAESPQVQAVRRFIEVEVQGVQISFQMDTGSDLTLVGTSEWERLGKPKLEKVPFRVKDASGSDMELKGRFMCSFKLKDSLANGYAYVRNSGNLIGLDWLEKSSHMNYHLEQMVNTIKDEKPFSEQLKEEFPEVFVDGLGRCVKEQAKLVLKNEAQPVFKQKRPVPYGSVTAVEGELERLTQLGVIEPVNHSQWAAPVVCIKKASGKIRVCSDFSTGLNSALVDEEYPLPTAEEIFASLNGGSVFTQIDLSDAYLQVELDPESQKCAVINTHKGLFQYKRLPFGIKTAPAIFQKIMDKMIAGLTGVAVYLDDIIVVGRSKAEHRANVRKVFARIREYGFHLKLDKCSFEKSEIKYLGFILNAEGRRPDPEKVKAIKNMSAPKDAKVLRSFLGMISYYGQFIPNIKALRGPLDRLLVQDEDWRWTELERRSFDKLKEILSSDLNLVHFNPKYQIVLAADASDYGIGSVISHIMPDGTEKPIAHAARSLTETEKKYSQIEKEALALIFGVKKFHKFIFGRNFILRTDHKPLLSIFGNKNGIPVHSQNRLVRWAITLLGYHFKIEYINTEKSSRRRRCHRES
ncbi:unnamed protein product [Caenorhabditis auriculariae]|uniref:RNA-directed DNA polymerase n=1 Tax=Caenorhabditis auriculariae TaxID=2777116 RepID=A0A8S1HXC1_9PELO|nr:unnamed protein product [Caenorhabditis auriculariae]